MARPSLFVNRKFRRLCGAIGNDAHALGYLEMIWRVAYETGEPVVGDEFDVETAACWPGNPGDLAELLLAAGGPGRVGFLERTESGLLEIHDFFDHCPAYVRKRHAREAARKSSDQSVTSHRRVSGSSLTPTPTPTPTPTSKSAHRPPEADDGFEQFWAAYPRKVSKPDARKAWKQTVKTRPPLPGLLTRLAEQEKAADWRGAGAQFCPYPATWLRGERWNDEPVQVSRNGSRPDPVVRPPVEDAAAIERARRVARAALGAES